MKIITLLFVIYQILLSSSIFINLEGKEDYCFEYKLQSNEEVEINYVISGYNEEQVKFTVNQLKYIIFFNTYN